MHLGDLLFERAAGEGHAEGALLEAAVLLLQALGAGILALVVAEDAVVRLVEGAGEIGAGIGQREALAAADGDAASSSNIGDAVALDGSTGTRCCGSILCGALNSTPAPCRARPASVTGAQAA